MSEEEKQWMKYEERVSSKNPKDGWLKFKYFSFFLKLILGFRENKKYSGGNSGKKSKQLLERHFRAALWFSPANFAVTPPSTSWHWI